MPVAAANSQRAAHTWATDLLREWDRQQARYRPHREGGLVVLVETAEALLGGHEGVVVELGCGCGSLLSRLRRRLPEATLVGVDRDPLLLRIAEEVFRYDDGAFLVDGDLRYLDLAGRLPGGVADVVVSCTALHWLAGPELKSVYETARRLLAPGGVLINMDWMPALAGDRYRQAAEAEIEVGLRLAESSGAPSWHQWWEMAASCPELSEVARLRGERGYERSAEFMPDIGWHNEQLLSAGFAEAAEIWRAFDSTAVLALT